MSSKLDSIVQQTPNGPVVLYLPEGMLGFSQQTRYVLVREENLHPFFRLQCVDDQDLAFPVMDPHLIDRDYTRLLPSKEIASLKISSRSELLVLVVASLRETPSDSSVNLKAPLLINHTTMMGRQIILPDLDMRAPVPALVGDASAALPASIG
jgi:flagellar assembly factor FliW